jgi:hypothetical protein
MQLMNRYFAVLFILALVLCGCYSKSSIKVSEFPISDSVEQTAVFDKLVLMTKITPSENQNDSLAFLILPVHASCPFCRKKTIDKIVKNISGMDNHHFIIISANGGRRTILGYFSEQNYALPESKNLYLDSTNKAFDYKLYTDKPTMYYSFQKKVYKRVEAIPHTVRKDLAHFFQVN